MSETQSVEDTDTEQTTDHLAIIEADWLADLIDAATPLVDEAKIRLDDTGMSIKAVDPANVGMVDATLNESAFESYNGDEGVLGVNLSRLDDILGMADSNSLVHLELDEETRKLRIEFDGLSYTLALIDPEAIRKEPDMPDLDLNARAVMEGKDVSRMVKATDMVSDHIALRSTTDYEGSGEGAFLAVATGDTDDVSLTFDGEDLLDHEWSDVESMFSLDYLGELEGAVEKDDAVAIRIGDELPMMLNHSRGENGELAVEYVLAPRIQNQ